VKESAIDIAVAVSNREKDAVSSIVHNIQRIPGVSESARIGRYRMRKTTEAACSMRLNAFMNSTNLKFGKN